MKPIQAQYQCKNASLVWVDETLVGVKNSENVLSGIASILIDITEEKRVQEALTLNEMKFRDFVETTEEWFWEVDDHLNFTYSNPQIETILGYTPSEILGTNMLDYIAKEERDSVKEQIKMHFREHIRWSKKVNQWIHRNGSIRSLESNAHPILLESTKLIGFRGADRDVTKRVEVEKSKREFLSVINHELRTPLSSIIGALGLISSEENVSEKIKNLSTIAYRNAERLAGIVSDMLSIEKIGFEKLELDLTPISIQEVIDESILSSKALADKFSIEIIKEGVFKEVKVLGDRRRLIQVMMNLLSNAIKFSKPEQKVLVSMEALNSKLRVSVKDQGIGIPENFKSKIFQRFAQTPMAQTRAIKGSGLGLNICKSFMEGMKGTIGFTSQEGIGSTFYFELPICKEV